MKTVDKTLVIRYWSEDRKFQLIGKKKLLLLPWESPEVLVTMDLMNPEGSLTRSQTKKLLQVNHMLQLLRPTLDALTKQFPLVRIAEAAAGNSYVSLILARYFKNIAKHPAMILSSDSNPKVVEQSNDRAKALGFSDILRTAVAPLHDFSWESLSQSLFPEHWPEEVKDPKKLRPNLFLALHACDSLSCRAIHHAMQLKADHLAIAPCCQAELAAQWKELDTKTNPLRVICENPNLRRSTAADFTDAIRLLLLRSLGYEGEAIEFVPSEHTPKNRLLLVERKRQFDLKSLRSYLDLKTSLPFGQIELERLTGKELEIYRERLDPI